MAPSHRFVYFLLASVTKVTSAWSRASEKSSHHYCHLLLLLDHPLYDSFTAVPLVSKYTDSNQLWGTSMMMQMLAR